MKRLWGVRWLQLISQLLCKVTQLEQQRALSELLLRFILKNKKQC